MTAIRVPHDMHGEPQILKFKQADEPGELLDFSNVVTLRQFYEAYVLPEIKYEQAARSLDSDRDALNRWERYTLNPDFRSVNAETLHNFKCAALKPAGTCEATTVNKTWRELKAIFEVAKELELIKKVPRIGLKKKSKLCKVGPKQQRDPINQTELSRIYQTGCASATYPANSTFPAPLLWRAAVVLFWTYGARTLDFLRFLRWCDVDYDKSLITFNAMKTSKLQGLPMTPAVLAHLQAIEPARHAHESPIFKGMQSTGCYLANHVVNGQRVPRPRQYWKRGFYATWNSEVLPNAGVLPEAGPEKLRDVIREKWGEKTAPLIWLKHFRETMLTELNDLSQAQLIGNIVAAHYDATVSGQSYDLPTKRVREAITKREETMAPACFFATN